MKLSIKQVANVTGLSADTLRYYEKEGIISPKRTNKRYRYYDENDIAILKHIVVMKYARFSLAEMKAMEEIYIREPDTECNELAKRILNAKIAELNQVVLNYGKIITMMETLLPMMESTDIYHRNEARIAEFMDQIFNNIKNGGFQDE